MIPLTKETIDNIFEPRRPFSFAERSSGVSMRNRLLTDGKGHFFTVAKVNGEWEWYHLSRPTPDYGLLDCTRTKWGYRKGTYPAWVPAQYATIPNELFECLPEPIHQVDVMLAIYRVAFPGDGYDNIVKLDGWPKISHKTWLYIAEKFRAFDRRMHPDVMAGGMWGLGSGFSADNERNGTTPDWKIDLSPCTIAYKWTPFRCSICRTDNEYEGHKWSRWANYIEWDVWLSRWEGDKWRMSESIDPSHEQRAESLEQAMDQCAARAGCLLKFTEVPPHNEHISAEWQSDWVQTHKENQRAA